MVSYPLQLIGEVYSERGNLAQARVVLEEALEVAEQSGDVQGVVPTLACLATVVAGEDPSEHGPWLIGRCPSAPGCRMSSRCSLQAG